MGLTQLQGTAHLLLGLDDGDVQATVPHCAPGAALVTCNLDEREPRT